MGEGRAGPGGRGRSQALGKKKTSHKGAGGEGDPRENRSSHGPSAGKLPKGSRILFDFGKSTGRRLTNKFVKKDQRKLAFESGLRVRKGATARPYNTTTGISPGERAHMEKKKKKKKSKKPQRSKTGRPVAAKGRYREESNLNSFGGKKGQNRRRNSKGIRGKGYPLSRTVPVRRGGPSREKEDPDYLCRRRKEGGERRKNRRNGKPFS